LPKVSVITLAYNQAPFIELNMKSIMAQTMKGYEHIILDDASTDNTLNIIKRNMDSRVRLIQHKHNAGVLMLQENYNECLKLATGEYVAMLDGDDCAFPERLALSVDALRQFEATICFGKALIIRNNRPVGVYPQIKDTRHRTLLRRLLYENYLASATVMFKREAIEKIGGRFQGETGATWDYLTWVMLGLTGKICFVNKILGTYTYHGRNTSSRYDWLRIYKEAYQKYKRIDLENYGFSMNEILWHWNINYAHKTFFYGRVALKKGMKEEARHFFLNSLMNGDLKSRIEGALGLLATKVPFSIEGLARFARRNTVS